MKNRELFVRDPSIALINNGQARISEGYTAQEKAVLRDELSHFVCEGKYADGIINMLDSFLGSLNGNQQPAAWVSGFYGSGKSHMLKMLHHLWVNTEFPEDGATARTLVQDLPSDIEASLRELDTAGRRGGGLHAASGTLPAGGGDSVRMIVLGIICKSKGLPESYAQAKFCLYLKQNGFLSPVKAAVEAGGKDFFRELNNLYVSPVLHDALVKVDPGYGNRQSVRELLKKQFNQPTDITTADFITTIKEVLGGGGQLPCTILLLDEVQQYIATEDARATAVVEVAEALSKELGCRMLVVGAGQSALGADTKQLTKLMARFTIPVELQDQDVEAVTRKVLLRKRPQHEATLKTILDSHSGEIERQLAGTKIAPKTEDRQLLTIDYPLLPTRRRFWEDVLRAVDPSGTSSMLRAQLRIIHDAVRDLAEAPVGHVIPADYIFDQLQAGMVQQSVLLRELDEAIRRLDDGTEEGKLARRVCGLIFLIRRLPRETGADKGIRATSEMLADLMVSDLKSGGAPLRKALPLLLDRLVDSGVLLLDHDEYNLQTREYSEWDKEFRNRKSRLQGSSGTSEIYRARDALLREAATAAVRAVKLPHGESKIPRNINIHFGNEAPVVTGADVPVWVRDEWDHNPKNVLDSARAAGTDSPIVFVFIPKVSDVDLTAQIVQHLAAKETLDLKGTPGTDEGREAQRAMQGRMDDAQRRRDGLVSEIVGRARVYQGGGNEQHELTVDEKIRSAAKDALGRLFPRFKEGDHKNWAVVIGRAKQGSDSALEAVGWTGPTEQHPVCKEVLRVVGSGAEGRAIRKTLGDSPYGWPQDAIDAALICLLASGHLTARISSVNVGVSQIDQAKIGKTEFKAETATLSAGDRIKLRGLFTGAGLSAKPSDDLNVKSSEFLDHLEQLAQRAGGDPPLPERPKTHHLGDLRGLAGNERLVKMLAQLDALKSNAETWDATAKLADARMPDWLRLKRMLGHAGGLESFTELKTGAEAIETDRLLLDVTDHAKPLVKKAATALRTALTDAHKALTDRYAAEMKVLEATDAWKKITQPQRDQILAEEDIAQPPTISIGSDDALLTALDASPLRGWRDKTDALPSRFAEAAMKAAKLLEPKTQRVRLTSGTLKTPEDVKAWIAEQEKSLIEKVAKGPIVIA